MKKFQPIDYVSRVAQRLIIEFEEAAVAGTPGLIGAAREHPARTQFKKLLPGFTNIGTGIAIDSFDNTSKQQDIIIFEESYCPVFSINDSPDATYYPIEGVISVGEVKSTLGTKELEDAFEKIATAKRLTRYSIPTDDGLGLKPAVSFRKYGTTMSFSATEIDEYSQASKPLDQVYGFILCGSFGLSSQHIIDSATALWRKYKKCESPNIIVSLNDGFIQPFNSVTNELQYSPLTANAAILSRENDIGFQQLIRQLRHTVIEGRTVCQIHYNRYFKPPTGKENVTVSHRCDL